MPIWPLIENPNFWRPFQQDIYLPVQNGLGFWTLNETSGDREDSTANALDLSVNGAVDSTTGLLGNASVFNGTNTWLSRANSALLTTKDQSLTLAAWVNFTAATHATLIGKYTGAPNVGGYCLFHSYVGVIQRVFQFRWPIDGQGLGTQNVTCEDYGFQTVTADGVPPFSAKQLITQDKWYLVIGWRDYDDQTINIQVNNANVWSKQLLRSAVRSVPSATNNLTFTIGAASANLSGATVNGKMTQCGLWNRVLSPQERAILFNHGAAMTWPFSQKVLYT